MKFLKPVLDISTHIDYNPIKCSEENKYSEIAVTESFWLVKKSVGSSPEYISEQQPEVTVGLDGCDRYITGVSFNSKRAVW